MMVERFGQSGAFYLGQNRLKAKALVLLRPGAIQARQKIRGLSSTKASCNLGQFWLAPLTIQKFQYENRKRPSKMSR